MGALIAALLMGTIMAAVIRFGLQSESIVVWGELNLQRVIARDDILELTGRCQRDSSLTVSIVEGKDDLLHTAVWAAASNCIVELLALGVDVNAADEEGRRPLDLAVFDGNIEVIVLLLLFGANLDLRPLDGDSPREVIRDEIKGFFPEDYALLSKIAATPAGYFETAAGQIEK